MVRSLLQRFSMRTDMGLSLLGSTDDGCSMSTILFAGISTSKSEQEDLPSGEHRQIKLRAIMKVFVGNICSTFDISLDIYMWERRHKFQVFRKVYVITLKMFCRKYLFRLHPHPMCMEEKVRKVTRRHTYENRSRLGVIGKDIWEGAKRYLGGGGQGGVSSFDPCCDLHKVMYHYSKLFGVSDPPAGNVDR